MHDYAGKGIAPAKLQQVGDGLVVPVLAPTVDVIWPLNITHKSISAFQRECRKYNDVFHDNGGFASKVLTEIYDDLDDLFAQEAFWKLALALPFFSITTGSLLRFCSGFQRLLRSQIQSLLNSYGVSLLYQIIACVY